jgi:hypothetical protein
MVRNIQYQIRGCVTHLRTRFKLHLRSSSATSASVEIPPLPHNKAIVQVFGDFFRYLYQCTGAYIEDTHAGGSELWKSVEGHAEFVLTHPNGWQNPQLAEMRAAAIYAGLVPDNPEGHSRIRFLTEGEASLHYCARNDYACDMIQVRQFRPIYFRLITLFVEQSGEGVVVIDAGGGSVALSSYRMTETRNCFEEIARGTCVTFDHYPKVHRPKFLVQVISRDPHLSVSGLGHS